MRALSLVLIAALTWGCALSKTGKVLDGGVIGSGIADLVTTHQAIAHGGVEANPVMGDSEWRRIAVKSLGIGTVIGLASLLDRKDPFYGNLLRIAVISTWTTVSVMNARCCHE